MRLSALKQQSFQLRILFEAQLTFWARMEFGSQSVRSLPVKSDPAINGIGRNAQHACDGGLRFTAFDRCNGLAATAFKFFSASERSHVFYIGCLGLLLWLGGIQ